MTPHFNHRRRNLCVTLLAAVVWPVASYGAIIVTQHADITFNYSSATDSWESYVGFSDEDDPMNPEATAPLEAVAFTARDKKEIQGKEGDRYSQPTLASFDFTGAEPGDPLWILPQSDNGYSWPGIFNDMPPGNVEQYVETDPRAGSSSPQYWLSLKLLGVDYFGEGDNPHFSLWQSAGQGNTLWMADSDGVTADDRFLFTEGGHTHMNWGFTELGIFRVNVRATAYRGPGATNPTQSDPQSLTFAIGTFATWKAGFYSGPELVDPVKSGNLSDSDKDNLTLLEEYAFNLNPTEPDLQYLEVGTGTSGLPVVRVESVDNEERLVVHYPRRKAETNPQITVSVEFTSDLSDPDSWAASGTVASPTSIDGTWEQVKVTDDVAITSGSPRYARVRVELIEQIDY